MKVHLCLYQFFLHVCLKSLFVRTLHRESSVYDGRTILISSLGCAPGTSKGCISEKPRLSPEFCFNISRSHPLLLFSLDIPVPSFFSCKLPLHISCFGMGLHLWSKIWLSFGFFQFHFYTITTFDKGFFLDPTCFRKSWNIINLK